MNSLSPALVTQAAVRRLPRTGLLLLCLAYVLPGFWGREPWKSADMRAYGFMWELAQGNSMWLTPTLAGSVPAADGLLPYWLGAGMLALTQTLGLTQAAWATRLPFVLLALLALAGTWYAVYGLARMPQAQPVAFAFGGEAEPKDYARAVADAGVLALLASLGLAQLVHEATPATAQLACTALAFAGAAGLQRRRSKAAGVLLLGLCGLAVSGAPVMGLLLGLGTALILAQGARMNTAQGHNPDAMAGTLPTPTSVVLACTVLAAVLSSGLGQWAWRMQPLVVEWQHLSGMGRLLLWFTWPAGPLMVWTLWHWRARWRSPHLALPLWFIAVALAAAVTTSGAERSLLLGLPAVAALAAFALPTLKRSVSALIDWFTLLFFSIGALTIWVVWIAMQTGFPPQPAANVARLAPGFVPTFSWTATALALTASLAWVGLVRWRVGRHQAALWKSLVLPAGGAALAWLLLMTLWLPLLDYARSSTALVSRIQALTAYQPGCLAVLTENESLIAALRTEGQLQVEVLPLPGPGNSAVPVARCPWLLVEAVTPVHSAAWQWHAEAYSPNRADQVLLYRAALP